MQDSFSRIYLTTSEVEADFPGAISALKQWHLESLTELPEEDFQENMGCSREDFDFEEFSLQGQFYITPLRGGLLAHASVDTKDKYHEYLSTEVVWDFTEWCV